MTRLKHFIKLSVAAVFAIAIATACSDMDEYFKVPGWISGNAREVLESDGHYSLFLQGAEKAGFTPLLEGNAILTVMAPDDETLARYLQDNYQAADFSTVSKEEAARLIGYHILYYAFDKQKLSNFRPIEGDGASEEELNRNAGLYYKFRTRSQDPVSYVGAQNDTAVYHYERLLPVLSARMFQTKKIDAKSNYEYFFPDTQWSADDGFQVSNAAVTEYAVAANNGYIHKIDHVLRPLETIYTELQRAGKYTRFLQYYDAQQSYEADEELTRETSSAQTLYHHYHKSLANIDCEWPVTKYSEIADMAKLAYSVFAPTDQAWDEFFQDYWRAGGYESIEEVDSVTKADILRNSVCTQSIVFPEEITSGKVENVDGDVISFDPQLVPQADRIICSNGVLYGCSRLTPPTKYVAVTGPAFQYKDYSNFLMMMQGSGQTKKFTSDALDFIMLYPSNEQMLSAAGIYKDGDKLVTLANPKAGLNSATQAAYVNLHAAQCLDGNTVLPTTGDKVYPTMSENQKLYWYVHNGKITSSITFNALLTGTAQGPATEDDVFTEPHPLTYRGDADGWTNGHAYTYDRLLFEADYDNSPYKNFVQFAYSTRQEPGTDYFGWINLLHKAGLINTSSSTVKFMAESCLMFVPTTAAVERSLLAGTIPGARATDTAIGAADFFDHVEITDAEQLEYYLKLYYLPLSTAVMSNYPYIGWGEKTEDVEGIITLQQDEVEQDGTMTIATTNLDIYDEGQRLTVGVRDRTTGKVAKRVAVSGKYHTFPFVFADGPVQFIEDTF